MKFMRVKVETKDGWYVESVDVTDSADEDFEAACSSLLRNGLHTATQYGAVWYPPHAIQSVGIYDEDEMEMEP